MQKEIILPSNFNKDYCIKLKDEILNLKINDIVLNFTNVNNIDIYALAMLFILKKHLDKKNGNLELKNLPEYLEKILTELNFY